EPHPAWP
ncbi:hypothetical protein CP10743SC13_2206, partial [Chlamydia psittaci 10_743_SC13]